MVASVALGLAGLRGCGEAAGPGAVPAPLW